MIRAILMSFQPKPTMDILNGLKTLELRSVLPKELKEKIEQGSGMWVYIYATKSGKGLYVDDKKEWFLFDKGNIHSGIIKNGLVLGRFWVDEYDTLEYINTWDGSDYFGNNQSISWNVDSNYLNSLCLDYQDVLDYGFRENPKPHQKTLYAWHIKKLEIFDEPMELSEFYKDLHYPKGETVSPLICGNDKICLEDFKVKKSPQSFMYIYVKEKEDD